MMDVAVPANQHVGLRQEGDCLLASEAMGLLGWPGVVWVDLRERDEREKHGVIPGSLHAPYGALEESLRAGGLLDALAKSSGQQIIFYCAFGERSAMAVQAAKEAGLLSARHLHGGIAAWKRAEGPMER